MMKISISTLRALASHLADQYPFTTHMIFLEARKIATDNGHQLIMELEKPLANRLNEMMKEEQV